MALNVGYSPGGSSPGPTAVGDQEQDTSGFWSLAKCRQAYTAYLDSKRLEIEEQQQARRYRHGVQWTAEQIKVLNDRKQPVVTYNKIGRKIDSVVGIVERLKQDPKAYPRTPQHQAGADLATAVLRYLMDRNNWNEVAPKVSEHGAVDGLGGIELGLKQVPAKPQQQQQMPQMGGNNRLSTAVLPDNVVPFPGMGHNGGPPLEPEQPDHDVIFGVVDNDGFFYDPRSFKHDFSDARYMGMGKFVDEEQLLELMPQLKDMLAGSGATDLDLTSGSDRDTRWFQSEGEFKQIRLVDIWYRYANGWRWCLFTGGRILMQGESPFRDEYGAQLCKYIMFSAQVDHDGDRYGFARNLMSPQDEVNQRRSKGLHELNSRRIVATKAAVADGNVEAIRREAARADGIVLVNTNLQDIQFDDAAKQSAIMGQLEFMRDAAATIENFGPNPALVGSREGGAPAGSSGRAIALMQQAGIAELGPYMLNLRGWKIRVYRALFNAAQSYWINQRWIRVTDAQGEPQFVGINQPAVDPMSGMPTIQNQIGELDVDIILDEGPDSITVMQDTFEAISQTLPAVAKMLSPEQAAAAMGVLIETSPLPADAKKKFRDAGAQQGPPPEQQQAMMKLEADKAMGQQKLQLEGAKMQQEGQLKRELAGVDLQVEREKLDLEREKAAAQIQIEREKANNQVQIEQFKATQQARIAQHKAALDAQRAAQEQANGYGDDEEIGARTMHYRNGLVLERDDVRRRNEEVKASKTDAVLSELAKTIGESHASLLQALAKPRRAVFQRDARGKLIGGMSMTED